MLNQELDEDILEPYLLHRLLKVLVGQHDVIAIPINEEDSFVLNFSVSACNAGRL